MPDQLVDDLKLALGDAYTIERELAGGGMSRVFVAREHALGREVVIKVLPPDLAAGVNRDRFRREVQLAARLSHPYIVPLLHAGEHGELLWFTMPYIPGESLRTRLQRNGALSVGETVRMLRDVVEALAYAHSHGVIHRDIKPGNILSDGHHAVVTDFGVAKALNAALPSAGPGHTTSGMAIGTPAYMAPEQLAADPEADHRVDIYAVGLLAYELLTGASPFAAPSPTATMTAQLTRLPEPLHQLRADVPVALSNLIQHCLAKSPEDRPPDARAVIAELDRISGAMAAETHRSGDTTARKASVWPLVFAAGVTLALVGGGVWYARRPPPVVPQRDTSTVRASGDTSDLSVSLPRVMTHQDSLAIALALRDQLAQIDPRYSKKPAGRAVVDSATLDQQLAQTDSLIRARLQEMMSQRRGEMPPPVPQPAHPPISVGGRSVVVAPVAPNAGAPTSRHLVVLLTPPRRDSSLRPLQRQIADELVRRSGGNREWTAVTIDSNAGFVDMNGANALTGTDVLASITFFRAGADSVRLGITVRNASGGNYGYHTVTSSAVAVPPTMMAFDSTLRDAARLVSQLRRLPINQVWVQDMGRDMFRALSDSSFRVLRNLNPGQIDSLRRRMDSLRRRRPQGRRGDSGG